MNNSSSAQVALVAVIQYLCFVYSMAKRKEYIYEKKLETKNSIESLTIGAVQTGERHVLQARKSCDVQRNSRIMQYILIAIFSISKLFATGKKTVIFIFTRMWIALLAIGRYE